MAQNFEDISPTSVTDGFYVGDVLVRRGVNGEFAAANIAPVANASLVVNNSPVYEPISATRPVQLESEQLRAMPAASTEEADVLGKAETTPTTSEKTQQRSWPAARVVGKVVLYSTLFGLAPSIPGVVIYNAGHAEHINGPFDIGPAITQTWHEAVAMNPFGGGR